MLSKTKGFDSKMRANPKIYCRKVPEVIINIGFWQ
jgi:hypothetical protein